VKFKDEDVGLYNRVLRYPVTAA